MLSINHGFPNDIGTTEVFFIGYINTCFFFD